MPALRTEGEDGVRYGIKAADSPRWCATCAAWGDHHTDRHDRMTAAPTGPDRIMREALQLIDRNGCENLTRGRCSDDPGRTRDSDYTSTQWCPPCIAAAALVAAPTGPEPRTDTAVGR